MKSRYRIYIMAAVFCVICILPKTVFAADTEYNFNKKKTVSITEKNCYAESGNSTWLEYKPSADGYLTVRMKTPKGAAEFSKGYIALFNSTKRMILSSKTIFYHTVTSDNPYWSRIVFGLKKGQTYYIRVRSENAVNISRKFTKVKDKSGTVQTKALNLKRNKAKTGLIPAGTYNADWYKITLTKKQKIRLYYNAKTSGTNSCFKLSVYFGKRLRAVKNMYYTVSEQRFTLCRYDPSTRKTSSLEAGTYYIKIERANSTSSGYYKLKWM